MSKINVTLNRVDNINELYFFEKDKSGNTSDLGSITNVTSEMIPKVGEFLSLEIYTFDEGGLEIDAQEVLEIQRFMLVDNNRMFNRVFVTIKGK